MALGVVSVERCRAPAHCKTLRTAMIAIPFASGVAGFWQHDPRAAIRVLYNANSEHPAVYLSTVSEPPEQGPRQTMLTRVGVRAA